VIHVAFDTLECCLTHIVVGIRETIMQL
jgi:hypothetical protein